MASQSAPPASSGFATICAFPTIPPCTPPPDTGRPVICLYVFDEASAHCARRRAAAWRRGALVAGAVAAGLAEAPRRASARRWCCARGSAAKDHRRAGARDRRRRGVLERDRAGAASGRGRSRSPRRWTRSASPRKAFPATFWRRPPRSATRRTGACACSRRSGDGCRLWAIRPSRCLHRRRCVRCRDLAGEPLESWRPRADAAGLGRRPARQLDAGRDSRAGSG